MAVIVFFPLSFAGNTLCRAITLKNEVMGQASLLEVLLNGQKWAADI
jgi:hypothetical protein